jgi:hypothetical protein
MFFLNWGILDRCETEGMPILTCPAKASDFRTLHFLTNPVVDLPQQRKINAVVSVIKFITVRKKKTVIFLSQSFYVCFFYCPKF